MRILEELMLSSKVPKMRTINDAMVLVAHSIGDTICASAQRSWHLWSPNAVLFNWQGKAINVIKAVASLPRSEHLPKGDK